MSATGADLVFVTGAPGSKWSAIAHALSYADGVDNSDSADHRRQPGQDGTGALHFGNYFGPGMEFGATFDQLDSLSPALLRAELDRPYAGGSGIRLVKSHLFSRHLPYLRSTFPAARFVLVHRKDDQCLTWWREAGGFRLSFPDYSWYEDTETMLRHIGKDNEGILAFTAQHGVRLIRHRSMKPVLAALGMTYSEDGVRRRGESAFEQQYGLGRLSCAEFLDHAHGVARLAGIAVVGPGAAAG